MFNIFLYIVLVATTEIAKSAIYPFLTFYALLTFLLQIFFFVSLLDVFEHIKQKNFETDHMNQLA